MGPIDLLVFLAVGAAAGWLAGQLVRGVGFGLLGNTAVGVVGAFVTGLLLPGAVPIAGLLGSVLHATLGAVLLLVAIGVVKRA